ncbi:MAG: glycosyl transferase family 2 [Dehalococcoidia bacterium]|nr:glycosyl transferase family 2 [Dehalococcoidia bacterium]
MGAVAGSLLYPDGSFQHGAFRFPNLWMTFLDLFPLHHRLSNSSINGRYPRKAYYDDFEIDHPLGACFMVRRDVVEEVGAFCPEFFLYCEEIDWCMRMKEAGWKVYCHPSAKVVHYGGQSTRQVRDPMFVELYRSRLLLFRRHYSPLFQAVNRAVTGAGILWELFCALRSLGRGTRHVSRY